MATIIAILLISAFIIAISVIVVGVLWLFGYRPEDDD